MDVVKEWADMVKCRPVDLGPSFARRLKKLELAIRNDALDQAAHACIKPAKFLGEVSSTRNQAWHECATAVLLLKG